MQVAAAGPPPGGAPTVRNYAWGTPGISPSATATFSGNFQAGSRVIVCGAYVAWNAVVGFGSISSTDSGLNGGGSTTVVGITDAITAESAQAGSYFVYFNSPAAGDGNAVTFTFASNARSFCMAWELSGLAIADSDTHLTPFNGFTSPMYHTDAPGISATAGLYLCCTTGRSNMGLNSGSGPTGFTRRNPIGGDDSYTDRLGVYEQRYTAPFGPERAEHTTNQGGFNRLGSAVLVQE